VRRLLLLIGGLALVAACGSSSTSSTTVGPTAGGATSVSPNGTSTDSASTIAPGGALSVPSGTTTVPDTSAPGSLAAISAALKSSFGQGTSDATVACIAKAVDARVDKSQLSALGLSGGVPGPGSTASKQARLQLVDALLSCNWYGEILKVSASTAGVTLTDAQTRCINDGLDANAFLRNSLADTFTDTSDPSTSTTVADAENAEMTKIGLGCGVTQSVIDKLNSQ
jgi:hypothetical protein